MKQVKPGRTIFELLLFSSIIGGINLAFQSDPGFLSGPLNPYVFLALVAASFYGKYYGFVSLGWSMMIILGPLWWALPRLGAEQQPLGFGFDRTALVQVAAGLLGVYILGLIRDRWQARTRRATERLREISRDKGLGQRRMRAVERVNRELEERVSRQTASISALHSRVQELNTLNLDRTLLALLDIVQRFTGAGKASIWRHDAASKDMRVITSVGWEAGEDTETVVPVDGSIEGWVFRNNMVFSVKMLLEYENLRKMDHGRNLITVPITVGRTVWGVLNIEDMPFEKYNLYSEKLLLMILALAAPALDMTVEYDSIVRQADVNPLTGLFSFTHFHDLLEQEMERTRMSEGRLSVVVIEIANFDDILGEVGEDHAYGLMNRVVDRVESLSQGRAKLFHYKERDQLVALFPDLDYDGASFFSLQLLTDINGAGWEIDDKPVPVDLLLGYAALGTRENTPEDLLEVAEHLLEMQKV